MNFDFSQRKKIIIKIGSSLLVEKGEIRKKWLKNFAKDVANLMQQNFQITIVSSGAIALGRSVLKVGSRKLTLEEKQAAAAIGQIGDNDRLAARVAQMISADMMILFSDIDGLYDQNPKTNKNAKLIPEIFTITNEIELMAGGAGSSVGTGGMITKIMAAKMLTNSNCETLITNGTCDGAIKKLFLGKQNFTIFHSKNKAAKSRKNWLSGVLNAKGSLIVNDRAADALKSGKISLLPVGIIEVKGEFKAGEIVFIRDKLGNHIASGITNFSAFDAKKICLKKSEEVKKILGEKVKKEIVHLNNLVLI